MIKIKNMFRCKRYLIALVILVLILISGGCILYNSIQKTTNDNIIKTNPKPISDRLPLLANIEKCYWKAKIISQDSLLSPGPTSYVMYAYVLLKEGDFNKIYKRFVWKKADSRLNLEFNIGNYKESNNWMYSEEFNEYVTPSEFYGKFYIEPQQKLIYFEIQQ